MDSGGGGDEADVLVIALTSRVMRAVEASLGGAMDREARRLIK